MLRGMRTTLTLDDDVAAMLRRVCESRAATLRDVVNEALRLGLAQMESRPPQRRFRTASVDLGGCLVGNVDDVSEVLAIAEGEDFK
jgi:hypothetical protein